MFSGCNLEVEHINLQLLCEHELYACELKPDENPSMGWGGGKNALPLAETVLVIDSF